MKKKNFPAKKAPVMIPITKKTAAMPAPKQAGKLGSSKGKSSSCGK